MHGLADVHAHLTSPELLPRLPEVLARAREAGVSTIVTNGLHLRDNEAALALAREYPDLVKAALGLYPVDAVLPEMLAAGVDYPRPDALPGPFEDTLSFLTEHAGEALAIGEVGLDHYWVPEPFRGRQEEIFRALVQLALRLDLPLIIHSRKAEQRCLAVLLELGAKRVNWHCFGGRHSLIPQIVEAGHCFSLPANTPRSETFQTLLRKVPREQLLLETDCPYLGPLPGTPSEPAHVRGTAAFAAELWGASLEEVSQQFARNFERTFRVAP